jgi:hypothetical protein
LTKDELKELVLQAYATYNQQLLIVDQKMVFKAWYNLLHDLEYEDAQRAFIRLATHEKFMPRPGDVRRATINAQTKIPPFLDGYSAWGIFQQVLREVHSGAQTERTPFDEALKNTLKELGESAYSMHTNGDREVFVRVYEKNVEALERDKYAIADTPKETE